MNLITLILIATIALAMLFMAIALFYNIKLNFTRGQMQSRIKLAKDQQLRPPAKNIDFVH